MFSLMCVCRCKMPIYVHIFDDNDDAYMRVCICENLKQKINKNHSFLKEIFVGLEIQHRYNHYAGECASNFRNADRDFCNSKWILRIESGDSFFLLLTIISLHATFFL